MSTPNFSHCSAANVPLAASSTIFWKLALNIDVDTCLFGGSNFALDSEGGCCSWTAGVAGSKSGTTGCKPTSILAVSSSFCSTFLFFQFLLQVCSDRVFVDCGNSLDRLRQQLVNAQGRISVFVVFKEFITTW
mmetsp:Transcript_28572/g.56154  ORF Transcript_28572/g.56154 Transcript_28572/m.56154 type:complete len:133 (+) Transcript_28572:307-705(+)